MWNAKRTTLIVTLICAGVVPLDAAEPARSKGKLRHPTALELLDKYAQTQNKQQSYICKWQSTTQRDALLTAPPYTDLSGKGVKHNLYEFCYDGNRYSNRWNIWGNIRSSNKFISKEQGPYNSLLWDGRKYFLYIGTADKPGKLTIFNKADYLPKNMKRDYRSDTRWGPGITLLRGVYNGLERIDFTLRNTSNLSLRDKTERIAGIDCYVIYANKYKLWIDPEHGYNIAQAQIKLNNVKLSLHDVRFTKVDDVWIIEEAVITKIENFKNADFIKTIARCALTEIELNPDHDALGSFVPDDIPNGSKIRLRDGTKTQYTWQDGKVIDKEGNVVLDYMLKNPSDSAESKPKSPVKKRPGIWELVRKLAAQQPAAATSLSAGRVVHFPVDRTLGKLMIQDENAKRRIKMFSHWDEAGDTEWEYLCQARGDVTVPAGKRLALYVAQAAWKDLSPLFRLKPDDLHMLTVYGSPQSRTPPDDRCMPHIAHLTGLKVLSLENTGISVKGVQLLKHLKNLERLGLSKRVTDQAMAEIAQLPSLKALYLMENRLTNAGLAHLQKLTGLEELALGGGRMNNAALIHLAKLPSLTYLMLQGENFTDAGMAHLKNISSLRILSLFQLRRLTDRTLVHISEIANLENLALPWNENITDAGIAHLKKLPNLKKLDIAQSKVTARDIAHLAEIKSIDGLWLPGEIMNDEVLSYLGQLYNLRDLHITGPISKRNKTYYTDRGLARLSGLKKLESLHIGSIGVTDDGISHIAGLTNLRDLDISGCPITDAGCARLLTLKSLDILAIRYAEMTIAGLSQLSALPNLTELHVSGIKPAPTVLDLSGLTNLKKLSIAIDGSLFLTDADLVSLANLKKLEWLQMGPRRFTDNGLVHIAGLTEMERLGIGGPNLTDDGLRHLANMTKLDHLSIDDGNITDQGLIHLHNLDRLVFLNITSRKRISPSAKRTLHEHLPDLSMLNIRLKNDNP